jgi:hypothetical protein
LDDFLRSKAPTKSKIIATTKFTYSDDNGEHQFVIQDLLIIANGMWEERATTYQRITSELRDSFRILYVEANYSWGKIVKGLLFGTFAIKPFGGFRKLDDRFFILTPLPRLPLRNYFRFIGILNQLILYFYIKRTMRRIDMKSPILWTFLHQSDKLIGRFQETLSVYHCVDYWQWLMPKVFLIDLKISTAIPEGVQFTESLCTECGRIRPLFACLRSKSTHP